MGESLSVYHTLSWHACDYTFIASRQPVTAYIPKCQNMKLCTHIIATRFDSHHIHTQKKQKKTCQPSASAPRRKDRDRHLLVWSESNLPAVSCHKNPAGVKRAVTADRDGPLAKPIRGCGTLVLHWLRVPRLCSPLAAGGSQAKGEWAMASPLVCGINYRLEGTITTSTYYSMCNMLLWRNQAPVAAASGCGNYR